MGLNTLILEPQNYNARAINIYKSFGELFYEKIYNYSIIDILVVRLSVKLSKDYLKKFKRLKYIVSPTTGLNHIDTEYCYVNGINVISLKGENIFMEKINATPEFTFSVMLSLIKNIYIAGFDVKKEKLFNLNRLNYLSKEFNEVKIGIAGCGRVGKKVYKYCEALNLNVVAFDPFKEDEYFLDNNIKRYKQIKSFLQSIDVLVICISYSLENINFFSREKLNMLKKGSILINTSRGEVIDEHAILDMLNKEILHSVALDVISIENSNNEILHNKFLNYIGKYNNLLITPHIAGASMNSMFLTELFVAQKLKKILYK